jgi:dTMP kinase
MSKARYICLEGTEGVGKTTQTQKLVDHLKSLGYSVLQTKEPGTPLSPLTMTLRGIMLDNQYDKELTMAGREYISQAIRSVHINNVIKPALNEVDFIVQDRGVLSGLAYGTACGNDTDFLISLADYAVCDIYEGNALDDSLFFIYDDIIYLKGDTATGLEKAKLSKQEFETGDAMESRGLDFMQQVSSNMDDMSTWFSAKTVDVTGKNIDTVFDEILQQLKV